MPRYAFAFDYTHAMPLHALARWSLRLILALCLGAAGLPAGAVFHTKATTPAATQSTAAMPCHDAPADEGSRSDDSDPCDCCPQRSCDHVTCAIPACLPAASPCVAIAAVAAPAAPVPATPPATALKPPLRPPIA